MKYAIIIQSSPYQSSAARTAFHFVKTALEQEHEILGVYFVSDGVLVANRFSQTPSDEFDLKNAWQTLVQKYAIDLMLCSNAAARRGILNEALAVTYDHSGSSLADGFRIGGMGVITEACLFADRVIRF